VDRLDRQDLLETQVRHLQDLVTIFLVAQVETQGMLGTQVPEAAQVQGELGRMVVVHWEQETGGREARVVAQALQVEQCDQELFV
jgi:predicted nucleic acid-binding Zn ribbon protein